MESESFNPAIIGIIGAILTVLIKLFDVIGSWKKTRETNRRNERNIEHTIKETEFINRWLEAVEKSSSNEELSRRRETAQQQLDTLMRSYDILKGNIESPSLTNKTNRALYAITLFISLSILGLFIDEQDNWSLLALQDNLDSDVVIVHLFLLALWAYFFKNSRFYEKYYG